ncbi:MAG: urate hydroxylase PuuD [Acidobacteriales bacterium]|nr:urate hydroxylase PuuD [Terriglobales bacterium]
MALATVMAAFLQPNIHVPADVNTNFLMLLRWVHFLGGITWIGLLYFFNLVNVPFLGELDAPTKSKVIPSLMPRALWWFRWASVVTVLAGILYWGNIVATDAANGGGSSGLPMGTFFGIWTVIFALMNGVLMAGKGPLNKGPVLAVLFTVLVIVGAYLFLDLNDHGWESNRLLCIGIGGGLGWIMMLNVWGIIWRVQKRVIIFTRENAGKNTPMPDKLKAGVRMAFLASRTNAYLSIPMLFFMGAASHYPMFGR